MKCRLLLSLILTSIGCCAYGQDSLNLDSVIGSKIDFYFAKREESVQQKPKDAPQRSSFTLYTDEDLKPILQFSKDRDQNYTMGFGFGFSSPALKDAHLMWPVDNFGDWLSRRFGTGRDTSKYDISPNLSLNGTAFTPDELRDKVVNRNDRPYAFLLALSSKTLRSWNTRENCPGFSPQRLL